ncbi:MAG: (d)CMP kinase [Oscillospiraceae bacterium]|nr:(d)CMP kinase [Oscillospiraceae bacterium]
MSRFISIAIDGPSGAGKSTMADRLGKDFGFLHVDTGAMYRAVGLAAVRAGIDKSDREAVEALLADVEVRAELSENGQVTYLNGEDVSRAIRENIVSGYASAVSAYPAVRSFLLEFQRQTARSQSVIMDGRDIATVVLPDADIKIYLTASVEARAERRYKELLERGQQVDFETVKKEIEARDYADSTRAVAPLTRHPEAVLVDTSDFDFEESYSLLKKIVSEALSCVL